jgi:hypothetical protein
MTSMSTPHCAATDSKHILESRRLVTDKNLEAIFLTPDDVILEAEYGPGILVVPAVCSNDQSLNLVKG